MKALNPVQRFALYGGLCIAGLSAALGFASSLFLEDQLLRSEWASTVEIVNHEIGAHALAPHMMDAKLRQEPARYRETFRALLRVPEVTRIKVWDRQATVLYSDDDHLIGKRFPENRQVEEALAGRLAVELKTLPKAKGEYERELSTQLAEIYVPVRAEPSGEIVGAIEVYKRPSRLFAAVHRMRVTVWGIAVSGGSLVYLILLATVRHAYRKQRALEAALQDHAERLEASVQERTRRLTHLNTLSQLVASLEEQPVFDYILRAATELIPDSVAVLWVLNEATQEFTQQAAMGIQHPHLRRIDRIPLGTGLVREAAAARRLIAVEDVAEDPRSLNREWAMAEGLHAAVYIPLAREGRSVVVLGVLGRFRRAFTEHELELLTSFANQAAIALENARLFAEAQRGNRELQALFTVTKTGTRSLDIASITQAALRTTIEVLHLDAGRLYIFDEKDHVLRLTAHHGLPAEVLKDFECYAPGQGIIGRIFQGSQPIAFADITADPKHAPMARSRLGILLGFRSAAGLPILIQGRPVGVIYVFGRAVREFSPGDLALLTAMGGQIGIAIENARLYGEIQEHAAGLEARVKERTAELEEALRVKSRFLANMSHELRTPLNAVLGFSELLIRQEPDRLTPRQERYAQFIHRGGQQLLGLVSELLEMAEAHTGQTAFHLEYVPLAQFLETLVESLVLAAKEKQVEVQTTLDPGLPAIVADHRKLAKALHHVVSNAIRYTPAGGQVTVSARRVSMPQGDEAEIAVTDTGIGIRREDLERIFQLFEQVDSSETRRYGGAGLGLAVVRHLVGLHGGRVWAESDGEGHGASFIVRLPLLAAPVALRILVAGDVASVSEALSTTLTDAGYEAEQARTGAEVLERLGAATFGLLVLDIGLPDAGGRNTLTHVREMERLRKLPVLVLAGPGSMTREQALTLGADEFLVKPVSPRALVETVAHLLARPAILGAAGEGKA